MYYDDYEESYYDYDEANEEALDMACDMADRYGFAIEDAYMFALESRRYTPDMKVQKAYGTRMAAIRDAGNSRAEVYKAMHTSNGDSRKIKNALNKYEDNELYSSRATSRFDRLKSDPRNFDNSMRWARKHGYKKQVDEYYKSR